jgi:hypothetical protein
MFSRQRIFGAKDSQTFALLFAHRHHRAMLPTWVRLSLLATTGHLSSIYSVECVVLEEAWSIFSLSFANPSC